MCIRDRDLTDAGFEREDIYNALMWLEKLADYQEGLVEPMQLASDPLSLRVYTEEECQRLDAKMCIRDRTGAGVARRTASG